ncbi:hypothetical protein JNX00_11885 [Hydrogenophaga sp. YM1]|jgi:hypothetical protein|uniref:Uncharacterized protein n=1 Tax=Hydrogenophaga borbori TaxID=2294117 RepID=A0A372EPX5_9BURK|nr:MULTISPECIES: hypothetical protein [Hydrogenophaga]NCT95972.1 hypothetical protein [Comamonadaceae bacterium]MBN9371168.1 hypothetical protein [Hydrogenophaga sp.]OJV69041.1 MAG: hypothetical protein BGO22_20690 [Hydrogenophaga sp. 70-12]QRR32391.1 hypothetical protein JNX00_11885 [Hydrogenophaga sp. YM1]RFP82680.1 hypothetical protein DY262_02320 [Hydrogenophaga borbori]
MPNPFKSLSLTLFAGVLLCLAFAVAAWRTGRLAWWGAEGLAVVALVGALRLRRRSRRVDPERWASF